MRQRALRGAGLPAAVRAVAAARRLACHRALHALRRGRAPAAACLCASSARGQIAAEWHRRAEWDAVDLPAAAAAAAGVTRSAGGRAGAQRRREAGQLCELHARQHRTAPGAPRCARACGAGVGGRAGLSGAHGRGAVLPADACVSARAGQAWQAVGQAGGTAARTRTPAAAAQLRAVVAICSIRALICELIH